MTLVSADMISEDTTHACGYVRAHKHTDRTRGCALMHTSVLHMASLRLAGCVQSAVVARDSAAV